MEVGWGVASMDGTGVEASAADDDVAVCLGALVGVAGREGGGVKTAVIVPTGVIWVVVCGWLLHAAKHNNRVAMRKCRIGISAKKPWAVLRRKNRDGANYNGFCEYGNGRFRFLLETLRAKKSFAGVVSLLKKVSPQNVQLLAEVERFT